MMGDIWTVMWKEWKELLQGGGRGKWGLLVFVGIFGVFLPLQIGRAWVESPATLIYWAWIPLFLVTGVIVDSFAGERERHTLETLLASRLSDWAILFGKVAAAMSYGWGLAMIGLVVGLVTINLAHRGSGLLLFPATVGLGIAGLSLLAAGLAAGVGVLVSLRASSVRQAQQALSIAIMLLLFVPVFGFQALPAEWKARLVQALANADTTRLVLAAVVVLVVADIGLLAAAMRRFRRGRLIAD